MSLRHGVLGLLAHSSASGYDLMRAFDLSLANVWPATQSQLYGELGKLTADGMIEVVAEGPRGRKEYAITAEGRDELRRWLIDVPPARVRRSDMLLRVFFLSQVDPDQARAYLRRQGEQAERALAELESIRGVVEGGDDDLRHHGRLAFEYGLRLHQAEAEWARWAEQQIS
ncbi:PadR family transcriptional regulator [Nonomuraea sp. NPDC050310]|uniref:PadR family transcriptional regulator n=1 Tax=unclassified Nonomuraea TaxID=2593643 RepID=UPI0033C6FA0B